VWLPDGEKISKISLVVLTQLTNVSDTQTDTQTPHDGIGRAYASHRAAKISLLQKDVGPPPVPLWRHIRSVVNATDDD